MLSVQLPLFAEANTPDLVCTQHANNETETTAFFWKPLRLDQRPSDNTTETRS